MYLGDLDPSGVDMERYLQETLNFFGLDARRVDLKRLALTVEQVEEYKLPPKPEDAETLAKIERDPRNKNYTLDYVVELDSLVAYVPEEFRKLIVEAIEELYNQEINQELEERAEEINDKLEEHLTEVKKQATEKLRTFLKDMDNGKGCA